MSVRAWVLRLMERFKAKPVDQADVRRKMLLLTAEIVIATDDYNVHSKCQALKRLIKALDGTFKCRSSAQLAVLQNELDAERIIVRQLKQELAKCQRTM